jgi:hypothetical protein
MKILIVTALLLVYAVGMAFFRVGAQADRVSESSY